MQLRNWVLQASNDGVVWTTLRTHTNDASLGSLPMSEASWSLETDSHFRHFRIMQTGVNSVGDTFLMCAGMELYGLLRPRVQPLNRTALVA